MSFAGIFSQPVTCLLTLDTAFLREEVFNFNEAQLIDISSQTVYLLIYLKRHHYTQGYVGFLLCCNSLFSSAHLF